MQRETHTTLVVFLFIPFGFPLPRHAWRSILLRMPSIPSLPFLLALAIVLHLDGAVPVFASEPAPLPPLPASSALEAWHSGAEVDFVPEAGATRAGLLRSGGGGDVDAAWRWVIACAAGGDIVVLRAGGGDGYQKFIHETIGGVASVTTLKFLDASAAQDPAVIARIASAEGVFLAGGDQS
ncbi:MAG: hypothetical protein H7067_17385, partial [Burkholderiales bacterium]|nr:hypothetical protein [Opitutaceae bacterium]